MTYLIAKASSTEDLVKQINTILHRAEGWQPIGGPFIETYSPGHGLVHAAPYEPGNHNLDGWIYVNFCQAMVCGESAKIERFHE